MTFTLHHKAVTTSTNLDAREGAPGDVFTADEQTAGRGRLDHRWLSPPGKNLMMSAVFDVKGFDSERISTFPLIVGLAVREAIMYFVPPNPPAVLLKWPNDVLADGRKIAGILCERTGDRVIAGIGLNVNQTEFDEEIAARATSLALLRGEDGIRIESVRYAVLSALSAHYETWRLHGFAALHSDYAAVDALTDEVDEYAVIGDCNNVGQIYHAINQGYYAALRI